MFFATVTRGRCFLQRWRVFFATVLVGRHVFCDGWPCFLHRQGVFSASVVFFATVTHVFCDGWRGPPSGGLFCG